MSALTSVTMDEVLDYATLENFAYLVGGLTLLKVAQLSYDPIRHLLSPLRQLTGPENDSLIFGNMRRIFAAPGSVLHEEWMDTYGTTFAYRGFLSLPQTGEPSEGNGEPLGRRQAWLKIILIVQSELLPIGILFAEFDSHKRQRALTVICVKLKDIWLDMIKTNPEGAPVIDVLPWLSRATLDIIGAAGFDYHFNSLDGEDEDELAKAFSKIFEAGPQASIFAIIKNFVPILNVIPDERSRRLKSNMAIMHRIGMKLVEDKKATLSQELKTGSTAQGRDLLTLLIKSNMAYESEDQRMTDDEVLGQISTFLVAGHETTSTSTTWALYALSKHPKAQAKLRQELLESGLGDEPNMADLDKLPYLDNVVRESLRLHSPVPGTVREAAHDVHIPVSKSFKDRHGVEQTHIAVRKGDTIFLPVQAMNRNKAIWGDDAKEFRPERWDDLSEAAKDVPGVWGHVMTFLVGNRSCIGYRFAVIEMKALLYSLIRAIEFDIDPSIVVEGKTTVVTRPRIASEPEKGNQMPLICKSVSSI
ncbi:hypothetical protein FRC10_000401 [Ceratobasidium sp. 414]|nr:hypothetical protein FRC10_000401 [Ceratobasidium sp. 414]